MPRRREVNNYRDLRSYEPRYTSAGVEGLYSDDYRRSPYTDTRSTTTRDATPNQGLMSRVGGWFNNSDSSRHDSVSSRPRGSSVFEDRRGEPSGRSRGSSVLADRHSPVYMHGYRVRDSHVPASTRPPSHEHPAYRRRQSDELFLPGTTNYRPSSTLSRHNSTAAGSSRTRDSDDWESVRYSGSTAGTTLSRSHSVHGRSASSRYNSRPVSPVSPINATDRRYMNRGDDRVLSWYRE